MAGRIDIKLAFCSILIILVTHGGCQGKLLCANTNCMHWVITCIKCTNVACVGYVLCT